MAFAFDSNGYCGVGQTFPSLFSQRHQPPLFILNKFTTLILFSIYVVCYLTNPLRVCQGLEDERYYWLSFNATAHR
jgi:hypothetical protein